MLPGAVVILAIPQVGQGPMPPWMMVPPQVLVMLSLAALGAAVIILWPIMRALGRRIEKRGGDPELRQEVATLRTRIEETERAALASGDIEWSQERIGELEDRIEFVERLLTREKEGTGG